MLQLFSFENNNIRTTEQNNENWFVLRDLLDGMGSSTTTTNALSTINQGLGDGYSSEIPILDNLGREQNVIIVSEAAATYLVSRSNTEQGRKLNRFIHTEVLPALRKTGTYTMPVQQTPQQEAFDRFNLAKTMADSLGFAGNMSVIYANNHVRNIMGVDLLKSMELTALPADPRGLTFTPTQLGQLMDPPVSARMANLLLLEAQMQTKVNGAYQPTFEGLKHCEVLDVQKPHSKGTPIKQVKWFSSVLEFLGETNEN